VLPIPAEDADRLGRKTGSRILRSGGIEKGQGDYKGGNGFHAVHYPAAK
jgi:hypothetical protein